MKLLRWLLSPLRHFCRLLVSGTPQGTLVVQPLQGIGDMIWQLPNIHAIAASRPDGAVSVLTKRRSQADRIFAADPAVRDILWLERNPGRHDGPLGLLRLVGDLRRRHFAEAWLLHGSSRYALALLLAGIPVTRGYGRGLQACLLSDTRFLPRGQRHAHPLQMGAALLALHGIPLMAEMSRVIVSAEALAAVDDRFALIPRPWIAFGIGSSEPVKQWGAARFAELANAVLRHSAGTVFLVAGPSESAMADEIISLCASPSRVVNVTDLRLDLTVALLSTCAVYVGNDTGALHLAAAVDTRAIGLFGASEALTYSDRIVPLLPNMEPAGCGGMAAITSKQVFSALVREGLTE